MIKKVIQYFNDLWYDLFKIDKCMGVSTMNREYSALDIATWFIYKTNAEIKENQVNNDLHEVYEGLTHLKLQKLLYYAQGVCLSMLNVPLFRDTIQAWEHGPVIRAVFEEFSIKGRNEITLEDAPSDSSIIRQIENDEEIREVLNITYDNFAIYTAWQLRNMTHQVGSPWYQFYRPNQNRTIPNDVIQRYFETEIMEG